MKEEPKDIKSIFAEAIEKKSAKERAAFLDKACKGDSDLRSKVEDLLKAHNEAGDFLEVPAIGPSVTLGDPHLTEGPGTIISRYKLLEKIGEGGMASVYMAEQKKPIRRKVALKIIKLGMDTKQVIARFEAERQALAMMDHPNIAKVLDAGATKTGRPYFVMELVKGVCITEYCDKNKLTTRERLDLFMQVCNAVQHAHQKGIIHRDIKPSNIMVTLHDGQPVPKVIDFGIAKATSLELTEKTLFTRYAQMIGTPEYMSPEQAEMSGMDIDTRTDIYSLGVLLYQLLTGTLPFDPETLRSSGYAEIRRTIVEDEPPRPSTRLSSLGEEAKKVAESQGTKISLLVERLRSELEWIPLKAMRKDRSRRYRSASELADDVRNYLNGLPLIAGPETAIYLVKKFVQRHTGSVATAALVAAAVVLGLVVSTALYFRAERMKMLAEKAEKVAEERAEDYRRAFYVNSIGLADAKYREGNISRVRALLDSCPDDLRGWEWYRLNYIHDQSLMTLQGSECIYMAILTPDGKRIVSGHYDGTIRVWDSVTGDELKILRAHERPLWSMAVSSDGKRIVSGSWDKTIKVWDAETFEKIRSIQGHEELICSVAVSPDGKLIASSAWGEKVLRVWDAQTGSELMTLGDRKSDVEYITFSPHGKHIISGDHAGYVKFWDAATGEELTAIHAHPDFVNRVAVNSDGSWIASTGGTDKVIKVWDTQTGIQLASFHGHRWRVESLGFSPDGKHIVSGDRHNLVKIWDTATGKELKTFRGHEGGVSSVAFTLNGKRIISGSWDGTIKLWDAFTDQETSRLIRHRSSVHSVAFSPYGKGLLSGSVDGMVELWDVNTGSELITLERPSKWRQKNRVVFSADGRLIASSLPRGTIKVWDAETGREIRTLVASESRRCSIAFSTDNSRLVAASSTPGNLYERKGAIKVWDISKGEEIISLTLDELIPLSVAFSPDSKHIVSGLQGGTIKVWDASDGTEVMTMTGHHGHIYCIAFSPDGKRIASASHDDTAKVWDAATGVELITLNGHNDIVHSAAFSPDGKRIISGSTDGTVRVWDAITGAELLTLRAYVGGFLSVAFSPDGKTVAAGAADGSVLLWESTTPVGGYGPRRNGAAARKLVDELHEQLGFYSEVIDRLKADKTLSESLCKIALQIANARLSEDAEKLKKESQESTSPKEVVSQQKTERQITDNK